jgi:large repetitive protein
MKPFNYKLLLTPVAVVVAFVVGLLVGRSMDGGASVPDSEARTEGTPSLTVPPGATVVGFLDVVAGKSIITATPGSMVPVSGWVACAAPKMKVVNVEVQVDDQTVGTAAVTERRPGVANAYGRADFALCGWRTQIPTAGIAPGTHKLTARATCEGGGSGSIGPFSLVVEAK